MHTSRPETPRVITSECWPFPQITQFWLFSEAPFGQAPFLEYNGKKYGQSSAIAAFFANEFGECGTRVCTCSCVRLEKNATNRIIAFLTDAFTRVISADL